MRRVGLLALCAAMLGPGGAAATDLPRFERTKLRLSGLVTGVRVADVDADGRRDLVVVTDRRVLVFRQTADGFPEWADDARDLPRDVTVADLWTPTGRPPALVLLDRRGVRRWDFTAGKLAAKPVRWLRTTTAWHAPADAPVLVRPLLHDCDGDGAPELLVPVAGGYGVYALEDPPRQLAHLQVDIGTRVAMLDQARGSALYTEAFHPPVTVGDADGDGRADIVVRQRSGIAWFLRDAEGRWPREPSRTLDPGTAPRSRTPAINFHFPVTVADLTGDGVLDYVTAIPGDGTVLIYAGGPKRVDFATPDAVIRTPGYALGALPRDLDGDGQLDLLVGTVDRIGILGALQVFVSKQLTVHSLSYYNAGDGSVAPFGDTPADRRSVDVPLAFTTTQDGFQVGTTVIVSWDGDFDGDGARDALQRVGPHQLGIWRGHGRKPAGPEPDAIVPIPSPEGYRFVVPAVVELDGDGRSDLILHYRDWEDERNQVILCTTRRR